MSSKKKTAVIIIVTCIFAIVCAIGLEMVTSEYQIGDFSYSGSPTKGPMRSGVKTKTNIFEKDDVTLRLYYGFYEKDKSGYVSGYRQESDDKVVVAMYVCDEEGVGNFKTFCEYEDYTNIENKNYMKEITYEEMLSGNYWYHESHIWGTIYKHSEMITISEELFDNESGSVAILLRSFIEPREKGDGYYSMMGTSLRLDYEITKDGKVKITNLERK